MKKLYNILVLVTALLLPNLVQAAPIITEVMYSPASGGEWVEIYNPDSKAVDLKGWKLFDGVNHTISTGSFLLAANSYLILADDKNAFISAFNTVDQTKVLDIVTSLNNDGDTVVLRNASSVDISQMSYSSTAGADKNGKTLQLIGGEFLPFKPASPLEAAVVTKQDVDDQLATESTSSSGTTPTTSSSNTNQSTNNTSPYHAWPSDMQLYVSGGTDRVVLVGARTIFEGKALSASKRTLPNADFIWTFGDGGSDRGGFVTHTYHYPGKYTVILDVISGDYLAKDEITVDVVHPDLAITNVVTGETGCIELKNETSYKLDIGDYILETNGLAGQHFTLPKNTIILPGRTIIFPSEITHLDSKSEIVALKVPGGKEVVQYKKINDTPKDATTSDSTQSGTTGTATVATDTNTDESVVSTALSSAGEYVSTHILPSFFIQNEDVKTSDLIETSEGSTTLGESLLATDTKSSLENETPRAAALGLLSIPFKEYIPLLSIIAVALGFLFFLKFSDQSVIEQNTELSADDIEIIE